MILKISGICTSEECERLIAFTNNSGPLFIIGTIGISLFSSKEIGFKLFFAHLLSCLLVGFIFRWWKYKKKISNSGKRFSPTSSIPLGFSTLGEILSISIKNAIALVVTIGGFVVFFSVIISMLNNSHFINILISLFTPLLKLLHIPVVYANSIITGIIEMTNGVKAVSLIHNPISIIICSFLLGFGGFSVLLQVLSITSKAKISIKPYILGKLLQAIFSAIIMYLWSK